MNNKDKKFAFDTMEILIKYYPDARCVLTFNNPFQMLVAVVLSAQCTDERVNMITPGLFKKYPDAKDFANADISDVENLIHSCGFYKNKAKNIIAAGKTVTDNFNGKLPHDLNLLMSIPGVGRKSANAIMLEVFDDAQGIAVDTHVKRISKRIGFTDVILLPSSVKLISFFFTNSLSSINSLNLTTALISDFVYLNLSALFEKFIFNSVTPSFQNKISDSSFNKSLVK